MFGEELRKARLDAALTQEELASKTGLTREYISQLELDKRMPAIPVFVRICKTLEIPTPKLVEMMDRIDWKLPNATVRTIPKVRSSNRKRNR